jgi:Holliday junction resolvase RusA-like endonuclease
MKGLAVLMTPVSSGYKLAIPNWHPTRLNELLGCNWRKRHRLKKADRELIGVYARLAGVPKATGKRKVSLHLILGPGQRAGDPDCYLKSLFDALTACRLLIDDNRQHVELGAVRFSRGKARVAIISLEDLCPSQP